MKLCIECPFDLKTTFSVNPNEDIFAKRTEKLKNIVATTIDPDAELVLSPALDFDETGDDAETTPYGLRAPFGAGVRIRTNRGMLIEGLRRDSMDFWSEYQSVQLAEFGEEAYRAIERDLATIQISATVFLFNIGVGYVRLHLSLPDDASGHYCRAAMKAFEFGAYGDWSKDRSTGNQKVGRFAGALDRLRQMLIVSFQNKNDFYRLIHRDDRPKDGNADGVDFAGFSGLLQISSSSPLIGPAESLIRKGDEHTRLSYGSLTIHYSPWLSIIETEEPAEHINNRLLYAHMNASISAEVCRVYIDRLNELTVRSLSEGISETSKYAVTGAQLRHLKKFSNLIVTISDARTSSSYLPDSKLASLVSAANNTGLLSDRISHAAATFSDAEADKLASADRARAKTIGFIVFLLTIASLIGVVASVVAAWAQGRELFQDETLFILVLSAPSLLAVLLTLALAGRGAWARSR